MTKQVPSGKQMMIWLPKEHIGQPYQVVQLCQELNLSRVSVKVANGNFLYTELTPYFDALRFAGIQVTGWHYLYCGVKFPDPKKPDWVYTTITPETEAAVTKSAIDFYNLDAIELDVEKEFKVGNQQSRAERYLKALLPLDIPVGLCSYRFPTLHREIPWQTFLTYENGVDYVNPQVYWGLEDATHGAIYELRRSYKEYQDLFAKYGTRPYFPVGRNYYGDGYPVPTNGIGTMAEEQTEFMGAALNAGMPGVSFWSLDTMVLPTHKAGLAQRKQAIAGFDWKHETLPEPLPQPDFEFIANAGVNVRSEPDTTGGDATICATTAKSRVFYDGKSVRGWDGKEWYQATVYIRADLCRKI